MDSITPVLVPDHLRARNDLLVSLAQHLPPPGARPVTVAGRVAGWISPAALAAIKGLPGVWLETEAVHLKPAAGSAHHDIDAVLHAVAHALNDAGCIRNWRNEQLDVIAEGQRVSQIERGAVRPLGLLTQAVHLNAWTHDGKLWIARRAADKSTDPGLWDTVAGGLAAAGEELSLSLLRESHEEAGLAPDHLQDLSPLRMVVRMHRRLEDGYQVENVLVSDCVLRAEQVPCNLDGEVSQFRLVDLSELWRMLCEEAFTLEAELAILDSLQQRFLQAPSHRAADMPAAGRQRTYP